MKKLKLILVLFAFMLIPILNVHASSNDITINQKNYNSSTHVFNVSGSAKGKYVIVALYNGKSQIAMYVADVKNNSYNANIKVSINKTSTITIKVGDINGEDYVKETLEAKVPIDISKATVTLSTTSYTYNGSEKKPSVTVKYGNTKLINGTDYTVEYASDRKNAGTYKVLVKGKGNYNNSKTVTFTIKKANNPITVKSSTKTVKYKKVKKKNQVVSAIAVTKAQGKVTYVKQSGSSSKLTINKTTGKITVKKKTKKGTYKIKVKITAAGNKNYNSGSKTVTIKIKVK